MIAVLIYSFEHIVIVQMLLFMIALTTNTVLP